MSAAPEICTKVPFLDTFPRFFHLSFQFLGLIELLLDMLCDLGKIYFMPENYNMKPKFEAVLQTGLWTNCGLRQSQMNSLDFSQP